MYGSDGALMNEPSFLRCPDVCPDVHVHVRVRLRMRAGG